MQKMGDLYQTADWKNEKHVPVIECPDIVRKDELFDISVSIGKEVSHPNTTEHHIRWIKLFFKPEGDKFSYEVGNYQFSAHGEAVAGANQGPVYTHHGVSTQVRINQPGIFHATSFCNIHGLWESAKEVKVE